MSAEKPTALRPTAGPVKLWLARLAWVMPAAFLVMMAVPRLRTGIAVNEAFPVPVYMTMDYRVPRADYLAAAGFLAGADPQDGNAAIARAEALGNSGAPAAVVRTILRRGLGAAPVSARGWLLLAEREPDPANAARALQLSLTFANYDYWLAARQAKDIAALWPAIAQQDRPEDLRRLRLLWDAPELRRALPDFLAGARGPALLTEAMKSTPDDIRGLNLWLAQMRLQAALRAAREGQR